MNSNDILQKLKSIEYNSSYLRVSSTHPLELYLGKNESGYFTLRYNGDFKPRKIIGNNILEVKQFKNIDGYSILFSYIGQEDKEIFCNFCEDLINQTKFCNKENGYNELVSRYEKWKRLFKVNNQLLSDSQIMGLIGELLFLKDDIINQYGISKGIDGWSGPELTHKDFSFDKDWFEIKTISNSRTEITISSIEQLDSHHNGKLIVYKLEKISPSFDGISLNKLVESIEDKITTTIDKFHFREKLEKVGYYKDDYYDSYVFEIIEKKQYKVTNGFPRLVSSNMPKAISKVNYNLLLSMLDDYLEE